jgi:hypothetical protein
MRGTPHCHSLVCVRSGGVQTEDISSKTDPAAHDRVKNVVRRVVTALLEPRPPDYADDDLPILDRDELRREETDYHWKNKKVTLLIMSIHVAKASTSI